jgi:hypothetical protein
MTGPVTIASVRAHGVRQLLVYCRGRRTGDWPCHHEATLPVDRFGADEALRDYRATMPLHRLRVAARRSAARLQRAAGTTDERGMDKTA